MIQSTTKFGDAGFARVNTPRVAGRFCDVKSGDKANQGLHVGRAFKIEASSRNGLWKQRKRAISELTLTIADQRDYSCLLPTLCEPMMSSVTEVAEIGAMHISQRSLYEARLDVRSSRL
jgi:hypothetical protein